MTCNQLVVGSIPTASTKAFHSQTCLTCLTRRVCLVQSNHQGNLWLRPWAIPDLTVDQGLSASNRHG